MNSELLPNSQPTSAIEGKGDSPLKEKILANQSFQRFANSFSSYQNVLNGAKSDNARGVIKKRMHDLYLPRVKINSDLDPKLREIIEMADFALGSSENNSYTKEALADKLSSLSVGNDFLMEWSAESGKMERGGTYVNELVNYEKKSDNSISIAIGRTDVEPEAFMKKTLEGFGKIADLLSQKILDCDKIVMKSWLFGKKFRSTAQKVLGVDVTIDESPDNEDTEAIQFNALQYNSKALKKYLETGEKPDVGIVEMTKQEFINKF